ncbi:MAG: DUF2304 domain-containing protein [Solobacterium sp.]|nr:DUF2304 domain-containing protein [Solobacterium sp.]
MEILPMSLRILLTAVTVLVLVFVIYSSRKAQMEVRSAVVWIAWAFVLLMFALFPAAVAMISELLGFLAPANFVFLLMIGILFFFSYYLFQRMSRMAREIKQLNYEIAVLKKKNGEKESDDEA